MNSALGNSRTIIALQKNPYFLKVAGFLMPLFIVFDALSTLSGLETCVFSTR